MPLDFQRARPLLQNGNLSKLFVEELGWEPCRQKLTLRAGETDYAFTAIAEKRGFTAWLCANADGKLPDHTTRLKLDRALTQTSFEHLIVFPTRDGTQQSWMWVRRKTGKPLAARTHEFNRTQPGDSLLQKLQHLYISLEDEERGDVHTLTLSAGAQAAFDIERVTKKFYKDFDAHRIAFLKFIDGIGEVADREWYASVMLNRLMFVYFIQRKGFLDGDHDYLRNRLDRCKREQGKDQFYTFYRYFLLRLFREGFGKRRKDRAPDLEKLIGNIPYLNGGLFDVHELEKPERYGKVIQIPDKAFERIFNYFDQYQWHLDERPLRDDNEINPDVLGYIFEKYINQKQMGAYYSKEDITEYISKNTVLPFLFDAARAKCKVAFENPNGPTVWDLLRENPDRFIYPAVRHGTDKKLPPEIAAGLDTTKPNLIERRKVWNRPAPSDYALPTEIWREVVARRQRYGEVRQKLATGQVLEVNDFITLNLDLRQFAQDVIQNCEGPDLLMALWQPITTITVLDPTGGSGAFIFAALNILEPLYEACLDRMEAFLAEWGENGKKTHPNYHKKFTEVLARVDAHPNRRYFVLKSIIINNLYAVDIMEEAVEICKLRLFLKLAAQVEPDVGRDNLGIEPLPDIDFNIRAGNTLVGYATAQEVRKCLTSEKTSGHDQMRLGVLGEKDAYATFEDKLQIADAAYRSFRQQQTELGGIVTAQDKADLKTKLKTLEDELNCYLAREYGVKVSDKPAYSNWLKSHQPFHWFIQFYSIIARGGFDVTIGNPPYVEYGTKLQSQYQVRNYATLSCGNLHAFCAERSLSLTSPSGCVGLIVPLPSINTDRMAALQSLVKPNTGAKGRSLWVSAFDERPSNLFSGVDQRLVIEIFGAEAQPPTLATTGINRWASKTRDNLFPTIAYSLQDNESIGRTRTILKLKNVAIETSLLRKLYSNDPIEHFRSTLPTKNLVAYRTAGGRYWKVALDTPFDSEAVSGKVAYLQGISGRQAVALISSSTFWWYYSSHFDMYNLKDYMIFGFRFSSASQSILADLDKIAGKLVKSIEHNAEVQTMQSQTRGAVEQKIYKAGKSKPIIDEIDTVLAEHYGFTEEELDFIVNYDIKYRLGRDTETEEE